MTALPTPFTPPQRLVDAILRGECVAFVGAGFAGPEAPSWGDLLRLLAAEVDEELVAQIDAMLKIEPKSAHRFETAGEIVKERLGARFEQVLHEVMRVDVPAAISARRDTLLSIPFHSILTTNFDGILNAGVSRTDARDHRLRWNEVIRTPQQWWASGRWNESRLLSTPIIRLHGDANGDPEREPVILARTDYRKRIYDDPHYAERLRILLATKTFLFLGTSFTDAYLNELRSSVLALLGHSRGAAPVAYAIVNRRPPLESQYFRDVEGIEFLEYDLETDGPREDEHRGFDRWLEAIRAATSVGARLARLAPGAHVVWVDKNASDNTVGLEHLQSQGIRVTQLRHHRELDVAEHGEADLIITRWGYRDHAEPEALELFQKTAAWPDGRPPIIVFSTDIDAAARHRQVMRLGGYGYCFTWSELFRLVEQVFTGPRGSAA